MLQSPDQILTVAQMRAAEDGLIAAGTSVDELMRRAGRGAAEWVWRIAANRVVTVLCGPGNNGGDGYVIAEALRERGGAVTVVALAEPRTAAALTARALYRGVPVGGDTELAGDVLVDCLFGSGLARPLADDTAALLARLAATHRHAIAIDLPSGIAADSGALLNTGLPSYDLTIALGAWKFAHALMPASAMMGALRLVDIGVAPVDGAARWIGRPSLTAPPPNSHKYRRGLLGVIVGEMPGAAVLAVTTAQGAGAGYVKLLAESADGGAMSGPADIAGVCARPELVIDRRRLRDALSDRRLNAVLIGPGLGRGDRAAARLADALNASIPTVLDADALVLLSPAMLTGRTAPLIATPHDAELAALERAFGGDGAATKPVRALALAKASGMIVVAKGPDTVVAAPDGRLAIAPRASSWLSTAGTGDVLAGAIASLLATGADPFDAACQGVWLHAEASRIAGPVFTAARLADAMPAALGACL